MGGVAAYVYGLQQLWLAPRNLLTNLAAPAIASLMELEARIRFPRRVESKRLVMFYDSRVTDAEGDLAVMERHVAGPERAIGKPLREKIHWVRGRLLGQGRMSIAGLALGSDASPPDWDYADRPNLDRHELARAVNRQDQPTGTDAPMLLVEGWAEAHSGLRSSKSAEFAWQSREYWRDETGARPEESYLRALTGPARYHKFDGAAYSVGSAFVAFLIDEYGQEAFLEL